MGNTALVNFHFSTPVKVRFAETDANQHMSHVSAVIYMEQARCEYLEGLQLFHPSRIEAEGKTFVLANQAVEYRAQAFFNDVLDVYCRISHIGRSSLDMEYVIHSRARNLITCTGKSTVVYFDLAQQKSAPLPENIHELIAHFEATCQ